MAGLFPLIKRAQAALMGVVTHTPLIHSTSLSSLFGCNIYLKLENLQKTGSFKVRGAYNKIRSLSPGEKKRGVVTASSGNHAQGVAWAAAVLGIKSVVIMPQAAPIIKRVAARGYGADVVFHGASFDEAYAKAIEIAKKRRLTFIHPFDDELVMAGQGTIGLEISRDLPDVDCVVVPVGGGGLIAGIASVVKGLGKKARVIGVEARVFSSCTMSLEKGRPVPGSGGATRGGAMTRGATIADGIAIKKVGEKTFPIIKKYVDDVVVVGEDSIAGAILKFMERKKLVVEGAGAVTLAALMEGRVKAGKKDKVVLVLSGGNIDAVTLDRIIRLGLLKEGRVVKFKTVLPDVPGSLHRFTKEIAFLKSNILHIVHQRDAACVPVGMARLDVILETEGREHTDRVIKRLKEKGYVTG